MKKQLLAIILALMPLVSFAQTKEDINSDMPVAWLGIDFSQLKFVVDTTKTEPYKGVPTNKELRQTYFEAWNNIFISESKKYNVAAATHRESVKYALEVTRSVNENLQNVRFVTTDIDQWCLLKKAKIASLVHDYDFKGNKGLGLMFFVDGMSKYDDQCSIWAVYVNMNDGTVLDARHYLYRPFGFGIRNQYANTFYYTLREMGRSFFRTYEIN